MQDLLDVCYDYDIEDDILFNPIKSVCTIFHPNCYKLYDRTVCIGSDALKYFSDTKKSSASVMDARYNICSLESMLRKCIIIWLYAEIR